MSVEYYAQLERGALAGVSAGVLDALARALQLDDAERVHLLRLPRRLTAPAESSAAPGPSNGASGPACNGRWTPSRLRPRSWETTGWTSSPPTN
jgi:Helix-turn-helix domain